MSNIKLFILYFIILIAGSLGLYFYDDIFVEKEIRDPSEKVAVATKVINDVKYKSLNQLSWFTINQEDFFIDGDKIFTGKNSQVMLKTLDQNKIDINENSLVKIRKGVLSLNKGKVTAFLEKNLILYINGKKLTVRPSEKSVISIQKIKGKGDIIAVSQGVVTVEYGGKKIRLENNQKSRISKNNVLMRTDLKRIKLRNKLYEDRFHCDEDMIRFEWESEVHAQSYKLTLYSDSFLKQKIAERTLNINSFEFRPTEFSTEIYLQILGYRKGQLVSQLEPVLITIYATKYFPKIKVNSKEVTKGKSIGLKNEERINELLLDSSVRLNALSTKKKNVSLLNQSPFSTLGLEMGENKLSLCFQHPSCGVKNICTKDTFSVINSKKIQLLLPANKAVFYKVQEDKLIDFYWTAPTSELYKELELIIMDEDKQVYENNFASYKTGENFISSELSEGKYYWKVRSFGNGESFTTEERSFSIYEITPPDNLKAKFIDFENKKMKYNFSWNQTLSSNEQMFIETSLKGAMTSSKLSKVQKQSHRTDLELPLTENFRWRLIGKNQKESLYETNWKTVIVPSCEEGYTIKLSKVKYQKGQKSVFKWKKIKGAQKYIVKLFQFNESSKQHDYSYTVSSNQFVWNNPIDVKLNWTVTPVDITGRKCETSDLGDYNY
jgi:hypothetical protein